MLLCHSVSPCRSAVPSPKTMGQLVSKRGRRVTGIANVAPAVERLLRKIGPAALAIAMIACSDAPTAPTPVVAVPPPPPRPVFTVEGTITPTNGGNIGNVTVVVGSSPAVVTGNQFTATVPSASPVAIIVSGDGIVPRSTVAIAPGRVEVEVFGAGFNLAFYRELVRDGFHRPTALQPVRRWRQAPRIYLRTVDEAGGSIASSLLDAAAAAMVDVAGPLAGGRFGLAGIERGVETRETAPAWITVRWRSVRNDTVCGNSRLVGEELGNVITLYSRAPCAPCISVVAQHELGHAMGYWHTSGASDLMFNGSLSCRSALSAREREYMRYAYSRNVGNLDPDRDP
jgi:hypothetical protein